MASPAAHVLIADDDGLVAMVTQRIVQMMGLTGVVVSDGIAAIATAQALQESLACAILDVMMPGSGGIAVAREIRQFAPTVPIILMSGVNFPHVPEHTKDIAHLTFLLKPFTITDVRSILDTALRERHV